MSEPPSSAGDITCGFSGRRLAYSAIALSLDFHLSIWPAKYSPCRESNPISSENRADFCLDVVKKLLSSGGPRFGRDAPIILGLLGNSA